MNDSLILQVIENIHINVSKNFSNSINIGVLNGISGYSIFYEYYNKYLTDQPNEYQSKHILNICIDRINNNYNKATYCDGICGFIWAINFLKENKLRYFNLNINSLYKYIKEWTLIAIASGNYDFLHGSTGTIYYLVNKLKINSNSLSLFQNYINALEKKYCEIYNFRNQKLAERSYLGLAHGVACYMKILLTISKIPQLKEQCYNLLYKNYNFLIKIYNFSENKKSLFPSWLSYNTDINKEYSGLSWCLGDPGIGITLLNISSDINDINMRNIAVNILKHSSKRLSEEQSLLKHPCLCHGFFGAYKIFSRAYTLTNEKEFLNAKKHWLSRGLEYLNNNKLPDDLSILNGQSGIGLALIDVYTDTDHNWGECLLIS
ncbi:lanthionine synthetase LanC family protein [Chryseobacterium sp. sg2396]|uniref:lanthionine synthetase LanC family protein n=1 Tax=Chryseobacterium sp. sg2396 TaxID=3276280 RepID=UPI00367059B6